MKCFDESPRGLLVASADPIRGRECTDGHAPFRRETAYASSAATLAAASTTSTTASAREACVTCSGVTETTLDLIRSARNRWVAGATIRSFSAIKNHEGLSLDARPDKLWAVLRDFSNISKWHPD